MIVTHYEYLVIFLLVFEGLFPCLHKQNPREVFFFTFWEPTLWLLDRQNQWEVFCHVL